jgi:hypothetical protein
MAQVKKKRSSKAELPSPQKNPTGPAHSDKKYKVEVYYERWTEDDAAHGATDDQGTQYAGNPTLRQLIYDAKNYGLDARDSYNPKDGYESSQPWRSTYFEPGTRDDFESGKDTYYSMFVTNLDGTPISVATFNAINSALGGRRVGTNPTKRKKKGKLSGRNRVLHRDIGDIQMRMLRLGRSPDRLQWDRDQSGYDEHPVDDAILRKQMRRAGYRGPQGKGKLKSNPDSAEKSMRKRNVKLPKGFGRMIDGLRPKRGGAQDRLAKRIKLGAFVSNAQILSALKEAEADQERGYHLLSDEAYHADMVIPRYRDYLYHFGNASVRRGDTPAGGWQYDPPARGAKGNPSKPSKGKNASGWNPWRTETYRGHKVRQRLSKDVHWIEYEISGPVLNVTKVVGEDADGWIRVNAFPDIDNAVQRRTGAKNPTKKKKAATKKKKAATKKKKGATKKKTGPAKRKK